MAQVNYEPSVAYGALLGYPNHTPTRMGRGNQEYQAVLVPDPRDPDVSVLLLFPANASARCFADAIDEDGLPVTEDWFQRAVLQVVEKMACPNKMVRYLQSWEKSV